MICNKRCTSGVCSELGISGSLREWLSMELSIAIYPDLIATWD
jgi:hypothetical protein